jgi:hypothetical protein
MPQPSSSDSGSGAASNSADTSTDDNTTNNTTNTQDTSLPAYTIPGQPSKNPFKNIHPTNATGTSNPPDPSTSIFAFFLITLVYFVAKYQTPDTMSTMLNIIYVVAIISTQVSINAALAKSVCNNPNSTNVGILATIFPMLFIFGFLELMLNIYPGWVEPFSNTFGYGIVKLSGLSTTIKNLIKSPQTSASGKSVAVALNNIYNDPSIFINQFSYDNKQAFDTTWNNSYADGNGLFVPSAKRANEESNLYKEFRHSVKLKDIVGKFIWYILVGVLVTSKSYNNIINEPCSLNPDVASKMAKQYQESNSSQTSPNDTPQGFKYTDE